MPSVIRYIVIAIALTMVAVSHAQTKTLLKGISDNAVTESFSIKSGTTLTISSGATINAASGSTITGFVTSTDLTNGLALKAPIASPTFTGTVTIPAGASISGYLTSATAATTYQSLDGDLTSIAELITTAFGRGLLTGADAAATRTTLGLGTLATQSGTISDYLTTATAATTYQSIDGDLTSIAALITTTFGRGLLTGADAAATRTTLGLGTLATQSGTLSDYLTTATAATTYLPLTGGTLTGPLSVETGDYGSSLTSSTLSFVFADANASILIEPPITWNSQISLRWPSADGTLLTNNSSLPAANLTGTIANARLPTTITGLTSVTSTTFVGNLTGTASGNLTSAAAAAAYQPLDADLTSIAGLSKVDNQLKVLRVNAAATAYELATVSGGGGSGDVVGPASSTDNAFARFDLTTGKLLQNSTSTLSDVGLASFDALQFSTAPTSTVGYGRAVWDTTDSCLSIGLNASVNALVGTDLHVQVYNDSASTMNVMQVVRQSGASGTRLKVALALANTDSSSATTIGVVAQSIASNAQGFIQTAGLLRGVNTNDFNEGDTLWLSAATAGLITNVKPTAPNHGVRIGYCIKKAGGAGIILIDILNGFELDELHDVLITGTVADNSFLSYSTASSAWINEAPSAARTSLGLGTLATQSGTISDYLTSATASSTYQPLDADLTRLATLDTTSTTGGTFRMSAASYLSLLAGAEMFDGGETTAAGGAPGTIYMSGGDGLANAGVAWAGGNSGTISMSGTNATSGYAGANGGSLYTYASGVFSGGSLILNSNGSIAAGDINTQSGGSLTMGSANIAGGNITGTLLTTTGDGSTLTGLTASQISGLSTTYAPLASPTFTGIVTLPVSSLATTTFKVTGNGTNGGTLFLSDSTNTWTARFRPAALSTFRFITVPDADGTLLFTNGSGAALTGITPSQLTQSGATSGQALAWNGTIWAPATIAGGGGGGLTNITETLVTAAPNATVNAERLAVTGGTTNVNLVLTPKGTGGFILGGAPDGAATDGNIIGARAVDLQITHGLATRVAGGADSFAAGTANTASGASATSIGSVNTSSGPSAVTLGASNTASGNESFAAGNGNSASNNQAVALGFTNVSSNVTTVAIGRTNNATGPRSVAIGITNTASGTASVALGSECNVSGSYAQGTGHQAAATRFGQKAHAAGQFAAVGDAQKTTFVLRNKTTNGTAVTLFLDGASTRLTLASGRVLSGTINIVGTRSDGVSVARYMRQFTLKNVGGTTSLVGSVITLGTDEATGTSISITADDTNDALSIDVTGVTAETWRWVATVDAIEIVPGT